MLSKAKLPRVLTPAEKQFEAFCQRDPIAKEGDVNLSSILHSIHDFSKLNKKLDEIVKKNFISSRLKIAIETDAKAVVKYIWNEYLTDPKERRKVYYQYPDKKEFLDEATLEKKAGRPFSQFITKEGQLADHIEDLIINNDPEHNLDDAIKLFNNELGEEKLTDEERFAVFKRISKNLFSYAHQLVGQWDVPKEDPQFMYGMRIFDFLFNYYENVPIELIVTASELKEQEGNVDPNLRWEYLCNNFQPFKSGDDFHEKLANLVLYKGFVTAAGRDPKNLREGFRAITYFNDKYESWQNDVKPLQTPEEKRQLKAQQEVPQHLNDFLEALEKQRLQLVDKNDPLHKMNPELSKAKAEALHVLIDRLMKDEQSDERYRVIIQNWKNERPPAHSKYHAFTHDEIIGMQRRTGWTSFFNPKTTQSAKTIKKFLEELTPSKTPTPRVQ